mgnify:CR=1 FL=1|tara:strand:- start:90798 stop:91289 length:492 start_codon:yes stop_codon:yes gene_type:complete
MKSTLGSLLLIIGGLYCALWASPAFGNSDSTNLPAKLLVNPPPVKYDSKSYFDGLFGSGWCSVFDTKVYPLTAGQIWIEDCFTNTGRLISQPEGQSYALVNVRGYDLLFSLSGELKEIRSSNGNGSSLTQIRKEKDYIYMKVKNVTVKVSLADRHWSLVPGTF